jgi:hypothetical protein
MIVAGEILRPPQRFSVRLLGIAKLSRRQHARAELQFSPENGAAQYRFGPAFLQPCSLNIQAKYETLVPAGWIPCPELP